MMIPGFPGASPWRSALLFTLALTPAFWTTGCGLLAPSGSSARVEQDLVDIERLLKDLKEDQGSAKRQLDYRLETLDSKLQTRNALLESSLGEIEKRLRQQNDDLERLRRELAELSFKFDSLNTKLNMQPVQPSAQTRELLAPGQLGKETYDEAFKAYNLGRYEDARGGFEAAMEAGLTGDRAIEARYYLAESLYRQDDFKTAYDHYTRLITGDPSHEFAWRSLERLADIQQRWNRPKDALRLYQEILGKKPDYGAIERVREQIEALEAEIATAAAESPESATAAPAAEVAPAD